MSNDHHPEPLLISTPQAAHILGLSLGTVRHLIRRGHIRCIRVGRRCLLRVSDVEAFADKGTR